MLSIFLMAFLCSGRRNGRWDPQEDCDGTHFANFSKGNFNFSKGLLYHFVTSQFLPLLTMPTRLQLFLNTNLHFLGFQPLIF